MRTQRQVRPRNQPGGGQPPGQPPEDDPSRGGGAGGGGDGQGRGGRRGGRGKVGQGRGGGRGGRAQADAPPSTVSAPPTSPPEKHAERPAPASKETMKQAYQARPEPVETIHLDWSQKLPPPPAPGPNWEPPPPRTYPIPAWVRETKTVLSKWMIAPDGNAWIDLMWETWGTGYGDDIQIYEASWDRTYSSGGGGGQSRGGGSWGGGGFGGGGRGGGGMRGIEEGMRDIQFSERQGGGGRGGRGRGDSFGQRGGGRGGGGRGGGGRGGGGGGICRFYSSPEGCKYGDSCKMRHE